MKEMVKHCFGNYVIKTLLKNSNQKQQTQLIKQIDKINAIISDSNKNNNHVAAKYTDILLNEVQKIKPTNNINKNQEKITNFKINYRDRPRSNYHNHNNDKNNSNSSNNYRSKYYY